jgi:formylglycine-generating enzyme required for sulfatase activity
MEPEMKIWIMILAWGLLAAVQAHPQEISNVQFKLESQTQEIHITYDLYDAQEGAYDVMVQASNDQGKNWALQPSPQTLSGDVREVKPGKGKSIVWKAGDDFNGFSPELFQVRLVLVQVVTTATSAVSAQNPAAEATKEAGVEEKENQFELEKSHSLPPTITGKDGAPMVLIPAGYFTMGSPLGKDEKDEHPAHRVWVSAFYLDQYLVTFDQYDKFCDATGRQKPADGYTLARGPLPHWGRGQRPVFNVTWKEAEAYCKWAGGRLPTEAEWEKAARGGTETPYFWGQDADRASDYAWYDGDSRYQTWPVGELKPNPYGLFDIAGELWEWVADWYSPDYYLQSPGRNPAGPEEGKLKVLRGGSFNNGADCLRVTTRAGWDPEKPDGREFFGHLHEHGFRCVFVPR